MDPLDLMEIGGTGLRVTQLGMGGAPFGGTAVDVTEGAALETVEPRPPAGGRLLRHGAAVRRRQERGVLRKGPLRRR